jgi:hypothetical protein
MTDAQQNGTVNEPNDPTATDPGVTHQMLLRMLCVEAACCAKLTAWSKKTGKLSLRWGSEAAKRLKVLCAERGIAYPAGKAAFLCRKWYNHFFKHAGVMDAPRSGRPCKIPKQVLRQCLTIILCGSYCSHDEAASNASIQHVLKEYKVTARTLFDNLKVIEPKFGKHKLVEFKFQLKPEHVKKRMQATVQWLKDYVAAGDSKVVQLEQATVELKIPKQVADLNAAALGCVIWIDAKKFWVKPTNYKVYGIKGTDTTVLEDPRVTTAQCIHYYAAVNYTYGAILLQLVTGTKGTGYTPATRYKASPSCWYCRVPQACAGAPHLIACITCCTAATQAVSFHQCRRNTVYPAATAS